MKYSVHNSFKYEVEMRDKLHAGNETILPQSFNLILNKLIMEKKFSFNEKVVWDSHFGYEIGYFLGEGHVYETYLIDVITGLIHEPCCYPKHEIHKYTDELIDNLKKKYGYEKRFDNI